MVSIPKIIGVMSCSFVLCLSLSNVTQAAEEHRDTQQGVHTIKGEVLRMEGSTYFIKELGGKNLSLRTDATTMKVENIQVGDRIEAIVNEYNRALSLVRAP
jgi:hypothetical protein